MYSKVAGTEAPAKRVGVPSAYFKKEHSKQKRSHPADGTPIHSAGAQVPATLSSHPADGTPTRSAGAAVPATLSAAFSKWLDDSRKHAGHWTVLRPLEARSDVPLLTVQPDDSVFVSGDQTKADTYRLKFNTSLRGVTAIRLEVLPDDRLPAHGPGRVFYEGLPGNFMLADFSVHRGGKKLPIARALDSYHNGKFTIDKAIDADLQSYWEIDGGEGRRHVAVFVLEKPAAARRFQLLEMLFANYYVCGLGLLSHRGDDRPRTPKPASGPRKSIGC